MKIRFLANAFLSVLIASGGARAALQTVCPYCGRPVTGEIPGPPLAVMIDNHPAARPQSGLNQACMVFEAPVEGGITRFLAVFGHGQLAAEIGPVRSMRPYYVLLAKSLGAVLAHCGGSPEAYTLAPQIDLAHLDEIRDGRGFWRSQTRKQPHNLYTSSAKLKSEIDRHRWGSMSMPADPGLFIPPRGGLQTEEILLPYFGRAGFSYRPATGSYLRTVNGVVQAGRDGAPVIAATVVVIGVPVTVIDRVGRVSIDFGSARQCQVYQGGRVMRGYWAGGTGQVRRVVDADGAVAPFAPGTIWFALVPAGAGTPLGIHDREPLRVVPSEW